MAPSTDPPTEPRAPVTEWRGLRLLGFQIQAIEAIRKGANVLVSAPTGAGKTLVAEFAIADAVSRGRRCVYTAPIKALSNQKYRDFRDDPDIDVGLMTGDVTIRPEARVLIVTTEILRNAILEQPDELHDVDYVILDEIHFLDDLERGSVWEESLIFAPADVRFIALSATIANLDQVGAWIRQIRPQELEVIQSKKRPVPLQHRLHQGGAALYTPERLPWLRSQLERERSRGRRRGRGRDRRRGHGRDSPNGRPSFGLDPGALDGLLDLLQDEGLLPCLVFSFSRRDCHRLAARNAHRELLDEGERERMGALQRDLVRSFQLDSSELDGEVFRLASHGVGYHHAGMLPIHKEVVERMFTSGLIKLLFTTETFALGINMPARTVVFASLRKFDGIAFDYLRTRDYLQMAGRAGRQGIDEAGLVVAHIEPRDVEEAPLERLVSGTPEPILSRFRLGYATILHLFGARGAAGVHEAWDKSFNRFQHRAKSKKARERNQSVQRAVVDAHLDLLADLSYLRREPEELTSRGRLARFFYGFELQIAEMLFRGALEDLPPAALAVVFVGLVHEERRREREPRVPARMFGGVRRHVDTIVRSVAAVEAAHRIPTPLKEPDWGLTEAALLWFDGVSFDELEERTGRTPGDVCRTFRMAIQLMRQVRRALDRTDALHGKLGEALEAMNRREVDARHQLELG